MIVSVIESGMDFGPFNKDDFFHIEKSPLYTTLGNGVRIGEFALIRGENSVWLVEAKSSFSKNDNHVDFKKNINEIVEKLTNSFHLLISAIIGRHGVSLDISEKFRNLALDKTKFILILVINNAKDEWLPPIKDDLARSFAPLIKTFSLGPQPVVVLNDTQARLRKLVK